jgi:hypothetical protein
MWSCSNVRGAWPLPAPLVSAPGFALLSTSHHTHAHTGRTGKTTPIQMDHCPAGPARKWRGDANA